MGAERAAAALLSAAGRALGAARWRSGVFRPLLVPGSGPWEAYLAGLSESGRRHWRKAKALNASKSFEAVPFRREETRAFMEVWSRWFRFPPDYLWRLERLAAEGRLRCFAAAEQGRPVALQLIETYGRYGRCHAPWFDKDAHASANLATFMWFSLVERSMAEGRYDWLDLWDGPPSRLAPDHYKRRYNPQGEDAFVRLCRACRFMFVARWERLRAPLSCPECGADARVGALGRAVLALSGVRRPARAPK